MSDTTPWWERPEIQVKLDHPTEGGDDGCSISTSVTHSCKTAPDENGVMRRKCERVTRKFRQCPGSAREELESEREETDEEVRGGSFETSSSWFTKTVGFGGDGSRGSFLPDVSSLLNFPFAEKRNDTNSNSDDGIFPGSFFGTMASVFRGAYEFAAEMERLERGGDVAKPTNETKNVTTSANREDETER